MPGPSWTHECSQAGERWGRCPLPSHEEHCLGDGGNDHLHGEEVTANTDFGKREQYMKSDPEWLYPTRLALNWRRVKVCPRIEALQSLRHIIHTVPYSSQHNEDTGSSKLACTRMHKLPKMSKLVRLTTGNVTWNMAPGFNTEKGMTIPYLSQTEIQACHHDIDHG